MARAQTQDHVDYRFQDYAEEGGRIHVQTQTAMFDVGVQPWLELKGEIVYDAISGATPTGAPPPTALAAFAGWPTPLSDKVPVVPMHDIRMAESFETDFNFGIHHIRPEVSYSEEHDYISYGGSLNYSIDLNQKNTTLNVGWSHNADTVLPIQGENIFQRMSKSSDEFGVGLTQLLGPKTILTANVSARESQGYLSDPYRGVVFDDYPQGDPTSISVYPENRPGRRDSYTGFVSLTQFVSPLNGAAAVSYRFYDDSYGVLAHTGELEWRQKIGRRITVCPSFRYYRQTAASFYATQFAGDPTNPFDPTPTPQYFSSDYRLSEMEAFTFGISVHAALASWASIDVSYQRYEMRGLDGVTSPSAYPKANIVTVGARLTF
jgi:hypothetical protein